MNPPTQEKAASDYVAIDIAKATLQVQDDQKSFSVDNTPQGHQKLLKALQRLAHPLVVFEATGGYERGLLQSLRQAGIPVALVNPSRIWAFARSEGSRAKTDQIDAKMIRAFARSKQLQPMRAPSDHQLDLAALLDRRGHLVEQLVREKNRLQNSETLILRSIKRMIVLLEKEVASLEQAIEKLINSDPSLKSRCQLMQSVKGVGRVTAWTLLANLSEMELLKRNQLVALAGLAPFNRDSGKTSGKRSIIGGRAKVRACLYMAAHTAASCNPVIAPYVKKLRDRGKPYKCAIVAAMRKLLLHLQSLMKNAQLAPCH
jgi:transposase